MAEIDVLTPSAEAWSTAGPSLAGLQCDHDDNREKNLVHEFTHAVQLTFWREPRDRSYPIWWVEGLPEFDGLFHTTMNNRTDAVAGLVALVKARLPLACTQDARQVDEALSIDAGYSAGPLFVWFLADRFGEQIHEQLLRSPSSAAALWSDLWRLTRVNSARDLYEDFLNWLAAH